MATTYNATIEQLYLLNDTVREALEKEDLLPDGRPTGDLANLQADFHHAVTCYDIWEQGDESSSYGRRRPPRPRPDKFMRDLEKEGFVFDGYRASWPDEPVILRITSSIRRWMEALDCAEVPEVNPETAVIVDKIRKARTLRGGICNIRLTEDEADIMTLLMEDMFQLGRTGHVEDLGLANSAAAALKQLGVTVH